MAHFTKLWSFILDSTVWRERDHVRIVWITMLAMADSGGHVAASIPGLADRARVDLPLCEEALSRLEAPDKYSRSKEHDGRRIRQEDGGWLILNYEKHREAAVEEVRRTQNRDRQRRWRHRQQQNQLDSHNAHGNTVTRDITESDGPSPPVEAALSVGINDEEDKPAPSATQLRFACRNEKTWSPPPRLLAALTRDFPTVDVPRELRRAAQWCEDQPATKRPTVAGMEGCLLRWMQGETARGKRRNAKQTAAERRTEKIHAANPEIDR